MRTLTPGCWSAAQVKTRLFVVGMDELRIDHGYKVPGCSIETESERGDVHHQKLDFAAQQELLALNGGTLGHDLILSRGAVPGIWKKVMEQLTKPRHPGNASNQQDFIDVRGRSLASRSVS